VEDKAISEQVKWNGYHLVVGDGSQVVSTRMYTSLPSMWEGWTKNIYLGLRDDVSHLMLGILGAILSLVTTIFLPIWPLLGLNWYFHSGSWMSIFIALEALIIWAALIYYRVRIARIMKISPWYSLTTPLGAGIFGAMILVSAWKVLSGQGVVWRGRRYQL